MTTTAFSWIAVLLLISCLFSAALVAASVHYGTARGLLDLPGQRRSHAQPTPRGGGIGIVIGFLAALKMLVLFDQVPLMPALGLALGLLAVAGIGWRDDHVPQTARLRLVVHALAALIFVASLIPWTASAALLVAAVLAALAIMVAVNFCNFMDGINGMLALQTMAVSATLAMLAATSGSVALCLLSGALLACSAGFLPFNFPQARIFLGDVGSGALGYLLGALLSWSVLRGDVGAAAALVLTSALWLDAGLTLTMRFTLRRRWTQAHRSHLYQWLVRSGYSHTRVSLGYLGWTLLLGAPMAFLMQAQWVPDPIGLATVCAAGGLIWLALRRRLLLRSARVTGMRS